MMIIAGAAILLVGCRPDVSPETRRADIRGRVTGIIPASDAIRKRNVAGFIQVEGIREPDTEYDKAAITVADTSTIMIERGGERRPATFADIIKGDSIEGGFGGPVMESYPVQATARYITIVR